LARQAGSVINFPEIGNSRKVSGTGGCAAGTVKLLL
jgi:hypothetical protein